MDRVATFLSEKTPRRAIALLFFVGLIVLFRHLAPLLVSFLVFQRTLLFLTDFLCKKTKLSAKAALLLVLLVGLVLVGASAAMGVGKAVHEYTRLHATFPDRIAHLREHPLYEKFREHAGDNDKVLEHAKHYAGSAMAAASTIGHFLIHALIGLILAVVFVLERHEIQEFYDKLAPRSLKGTLFRWMGHLSDATAVTVQLQLIVAACNAVFTLPVLLFLGVKHVGPLMVLIFVSALVPVVGNLVSGAVLSLMAYEAKGPVGVAVFIGLTFLLHKVESYYLNPRLTARHVRLPGFLLIVSLIAWEHLLGFAGLFVSFPVLFVAGRIRAEFLEEDGKLGAGKVGDAPDARE